MLVPVPYVPGCLRQLQEAGLCATLTRKPEVQRRLTWEVHRGCAIPLERGPRQLVRDRRRHHQHPLATLAHRWRAGLGAC